MAGGSELELLSRELESAGGAAAEAAQEIEDDVGELGISRPPPNPGGGG
jgi:hypothetical protein